MKILITTVFIAVLAVAKSADAADARLAVHEWGTFTSLQDEDGNAVGGINTDDEPVPGFVHRLANFLLLRPTEAPGIFFQGAPRCHPDVTMRLETPVIYFHPPKSAAGIQNANVRVKFRGGWLSEFYPAAIPDAPGLKEDRFSFGPLTQQTVSSLEWPDLKMGGNWTLTNTTAHVWTAPRNVKAASVQTTNGESERFLFYRGVANVNAPLKISRDRATDQLVFRSQVENIPTDKPLTIQSLWLVDIRADGKIAFRSLPSITLLADAKLLASTSARFENSDFKSGNLEALKSSLQLALETAGLFADEARALLDTWELSYFKSTGLRVFFLVPRVWTDFYLPLEISTPAEIRRVMVGRIELVTSQQRQGLKKLAGFSPAQITQDRGQLFTNFYGRITFDSVFGSTNQPSRKAVEQMNSDLAKVNAGEKSLASFVPVPRSYQTYLDLGRFRNALILDEAKRQHQLTNFISNYALEACRTSEIPAAP